MRILLFILVYTFSINLGAQSTTFSLTDFYGKNEHLSRKTDDIFNAMTETERVAQMLVTSLGKLGKPMEVVRPLVQKGQVGGVIFLSGDPVEFKRQISELQSASVNRPLLMSMDAEPSLFNRRMPGTPLVKPTSELRGLEEVESTVKVIDSTLLAVGFRQNFAPVIDLSASNEAIGNRTFGSDSAGVLPKALAFVQQTQNDQIVATVKHFPGHGRVAGDTHKQLVYINGPLTEVNLYRPMIEHGVLSIMVGHIAVENNPAYNTGGMPSTLSPIIVTNLLRNELGFNGVIITDAMNMGAVATIPMATLLAAKAGCDIILMPVDEVGTLNSILGEMKINPEFADQIQTSVKRVIRLKVCLGLYP